ncbi:MAG: YqjF family protein [Haloplanus sp.]
MPSILTVTGRDVLFAHWPLDPAAVEPRVPDGLDVETFDGSAWVSVLALENRGIGPGRMAPPSWLRRGVPQLNLRTYVTMGDQPGVYFLSLDTGDRLAAWAGRRGFGIPFRHARMRMTRRGDEVRVRSRHRGDPPAAFRARYRPTGGTYRAEPDTIEAFCVEQFRYFLPADEDRRPGVSGDDGGGHVRVGEIDREPWDLRPVAATIRENTLFEAAGLPAPTGDPTVRYSPGFTMRVEPLRTRPGSVGG